MKLPIVLLLGGGLILLLALVGVHSLTAPPAPNYALMQVQADAARDAAVREANQAAALAPFVTFTAQMFQVLLVVVMAGSVVGAGMLAADWWKAGAVRRRVLVLAAQAQVEAARRPNVPHTYSPHWANQQRVEGAPAADVPQLAAAPFVPPTFGEMRARGLLGPGRPLVYGYDATTGQPITGDWRLLQSGAIAGYSGEGKSNTAAFIAGQAYEQGNVKIILCDPHAGAGDDSLTARLAPLADAFLCRPAQSDAEIVTALTQARDLIAARLHTGGPFPFRLLVIIDEFTYLMSRSTVGPIAADLVEMIAQEGRKTDTACQAIGQIFTAARSGSSALRDSLQGVILHRMKRAQARLLVDPESAKLAETLLRGQALFSRGADVIPISIPLCGAVDLAQPARARFTPTQIVDAAPIAPVAARGRVIAFPVAAPESELAWETTSGNEGATIEARAAMTPGNDAPPVGVLPHPLGWPLEDRPARVLEMVLQERPMKEIIETEWGISNGRNWNPATIEYRRLLAWLMRRD